jgi:hypothetical protein
MVGSKSVFSLILLAIVSFLVPSTSEAAELRKAKRVDVGADEIIDDTLVAIAQTVVIEGHISGDVVALARMVTISGTIDGNLITLAEHVDIEGLVRGSVMTAGRHVHVVGLQASQLYAAGRVVALDGVDLRGDAMLAGKKLEIGGVIGRDVYATADRVVFDAELQRDLHVDGDDLQVGEHASIGRDLQAKVDEVEDLAIDTGALIQGSTNIDVAAGDTRFDDVSFYVGKFLMLAAGLLFGFVAFVFAPNMFKAPREQTEQHRWARVLGLGIAALISIPILAVIIAVTLVGLPLALVAIGGYALALYLGKLFIVAELGRRILNLSGNKRSDVVWSLLIGLLIVAVLVELPFVGALIGFVLAVLGLGTVVNYLLVGRRRRAESRAATANQIATS